MGSIIEKQLVGYAVIEKNSYIDKKVKIRGFFGIGNHSAIQADCWINNTVIGNYSRIDKRVQLGYTKLYTGVFSNHYYAFAEGKRYFHDDDFNNLSTNRFFYQKTPLSYIGSDVRICDQCIVYAGVKIGDGALIYPNSVVTDDVEPYSVVAGNPAVKIADRFDFVTKKRIANLKWTDKDFSEITPLKRINYLDIDYVLALFESLDLNDKKNDDIYINSFLKECIPINNRVVVIGPSHVHNWLKLINESIVKRGDFLLYGEPGLSLYSKAIKNFIDWWVLIKKGKVVFMVPDFRIGNSDFIDKGNIDQVQGSGVFIYKEKMTKKIDGYISSYVIEILNDMVDQYKGDIRFIFWSLYAREQLNIQDKKYFDKGYYEHPYWNYDEIYNIFKKNIIDLSELGNGILKLIEKDGTTHPTVDGYKYLTDKILLDASLR